MKRINYIFFAFLTFAFNSCSKNERIENGYNQKANEIILQILKENDCNCLLEIPKQSLAEINYLENPHYDIRGFLKSELGALNEEQLNDLINVSKKFSLNVEMLEKNNIKILKSNVIPKMGDINENDKAEKILKMCPNGIINFYKPIFDKTQQKAILDYSFAFTCTKTYPLPTYKHKNGKWNLLEK